MKKNYKGIVKDCLGVMETRQTKLYSTWAEAQKVAEKLAKRTMRDRGRIQIVDKSGKLHY